MYLQLAGDDIRQFHRDVDEAKIVRYSSLQPVSPLPELTCHTGSHSVTCHLAEVTFLPLPQSKLVVDLATPGDAKLS